MSNYYKPLAKDSQGETLFDYPAPYPAVARYNSENGVASSVVSLHPMTSHLEVAAFGGQGVKIRWIKTSETELVSPFASVIPSGISANFDHFVPPNVYRRFAIPRETGGSLNGQIGSLM